MIYKYNLLVIVATIIASFVSMNAAATPVVLEQDTYISIEKDPSLLGTAVADPSVTPNTGVCIGSIAYGGGYINMSDGDTSATSPACANTTDLLVEDPQNPDWWAGTGFIYTTTSNTINISFTDLVVTAFSFKLAANASASGWIRAYYDYGTTSTSLKTDPNFSISGTNTYGVYVKEPTVSCAVITRIEIEPPFTWGVGDFGITTTDGCAEVPEPNSISLLGSGLFAVGLVYFYGQRRKLRVEREGYTRQS